ncbi:MAG TPA: riboflavin biosynthesis protein RibF [Puia sp.]|nr:riboflavin biosynthesis protein RibF [Puia sp.]
MKVHTDLEQLPGFKNAVVTIGTFDGVHTGHQKIIQQLKQAAESLGGETIIISFFPHPRKVVGNKPVKLINTLDERIELLRLCDIDHLVVIPFTDAFSRQPADQYVRQFLIEKFQPRIIVIGFDHRFGRNREGDYHLLERLRAEGNYELLEIPAHVQHEVSVSSTAIRESVSRGDISIANELLGYDFFFSGVVVEGDRLGRSIGFPTANLLVNDPEKLLPGDGVYAVDALLFGYTQKANTSNRIPGMMNIGLRPTVDGSRRRIEVNIFQFDRDIYRQTLRVFVKRFLRVEKKFTGISALKEQLEKDREAASQ